MQTTETVAQTEAVAVKTEEVSATKAPAKKPAYNYQIDVLKLVFSIAVFFAHTSKFNVGEKVFLPDGSALGWIAVFFFFMVSGMLMVNSYVRKNHEGEVNLGENSVRFVVNKFKPIAFEYWTALFLCLAVYIYLTKYWDILLFRAPEVFLVSEICTLTGSHNGPMWYISGMLICMVPFYYMLQKNKSFFIYVFAPIAGLMVYGYLFAVDPVGGRNMNDGVIISTILKTVCGLLCGVISWAIADWLKKNAQKTAFRVFLTLAELTMYGIFFYVFIFRTNNMGILYSATLLLVPALGITFSSMSYVSSIFQAKELKWLGTLSLEIYFTHWIGRIIVEQRHKGLEYWESVGYMALYTVVLMIVHTVLVKMLKLLWNKALKKHFVNDTPSEP